MGSCRFESQPGLLRTKVYSAFHPSRVGKWVPVIAGKAKAGMAHSDCRWTCGCAGKTVKSLENTCHTWVLLRWWFTKRRYVKCAYLYVYLYDEMVCWCMTACTVVWWEDQRDIRCTFYHQSQRSVTGCVLYHWWTYVTPPLSLSLSLCLSLTDEPI